MDVSLTSKITFLVTTFFFFFYIQTNHAFLFSYLLILKESEFLHGFASYLQSRLQQELKKVPKLQKFWNLIKKKFDQMDADAAEQ